MNYRKTLVALSLAGSLGLWLVTAFKPNETPIKEELNDLLPISQSEEIKQIQDPKEVIRAEAERAFKKMNDYSFRMFSPCGIGTGWILDYELTKDNTYPTTWYIATNAHVLKDYGFSDNPYGQKMYISTDEIKRRKARGRGIDYSGISLHYDYCNFYKDYGYFDFNLAQEKTGEQLKTDQGAISNKEIEEPKLFFVAINFLKEDKGLGIDKNHWKDFAVIQVKFNDPERARKVTNDFATNYPVDTKEAINVFSDGLESRYSSERLENMDQNFYSFGYPGTQNGSGRDKFKSSKTWDENTLMAERFSNDQHNWYHKNGDKRHNGFISSKRAGAPLEWGNETFQRFGHYYFMQNFPLGKGSSGAMYVDKDNNLLGLKALVEVGQGAKNSWVEPLRSKGIDKDGIKTPAYDLILGGENHVSSYKQQIQEHVINKGRETFLSKRGWKHIN